MTIEISEAELTKLYTQMAANNLTPLWTLEADVMPWQPQPLAIPWLWQWSDLYSIAERSGALVPVERGGDRRAIALSNPGLAPKPFATPTLWAAVQWLNGREVAPAHRHTAQAVRWIIAGHGGYSTVEGDKVYLEPGDLVLNPPWYWHDHGSDSDERSIWMDGLDIPLNGYLDASFFEPYPSDQQPVTELQDGKHLKYGVGTLQPAWEAKSELYPPISTYKWADTERALTNLAKVAEAGVEGAVSPYDDIALEFTNPHSGGPVMKTMSCWIQLLRSGVRTQAHRQVESAVYYVHEGSGSTIINGVRFNWQKGDMFAIPSWTWHEHHTGPSSERAILFSIHDTPVMTALGKYREEGYGEHGGHQQVTGAFTGQLPAQVQSKLRGKSC